MAHYLLIDLHLFENHDLPLFWYLLFKGNSVFGILWESCFYSNFQPKKVQKLNSKADYEVNDQPIFAKKNFEAKADCERTSSLHQSAEAVHLVLLCYFTDTIRCDVSAEKYGCWQSPLLLRYLRIFLHYSFRDLPEIFRPKFGYFVAMKYFFFIDLQRN